MKTKRSTYTVTLLVIFTCLLFVATIKLSMGKVGMQILGMEPIPELNDQQVIKEEIAEWTSFQITF